MKLRHVDLLSLPSCLKLADSFAPRGVGDVAGFSLSFSGCSCILLSALLSVVPCGASHGSLTGKLGELCLRSSFRRLHLHLFSCRPNLKRLFKMNFWNQIKMLGWRWWDLSWAQEVSDAWTIKCTSVGWHRQLRASLHGWLFLHFVNFDILTSGLPTRWDAKFSCSLFPLRWKRISKFPRNGKRAVRWTKRGHRLLQPLGENNHKRS